VESPLGWPDLLIEGRPVAEFLAWLEPWQWCVSGKFTPICLSRFGCWFLMRPDGTVEMLDVFFGHVEEVAGSVAELKAAVDDPAWQAAYLLSDFVYRLHGAGKFASGISCYALAPHPAVGGPDPWGSTPLETDAVMVMDAPGWQALCSQFVLASREAHPG
jgi:hypothetical protein